MITMWWKLTTRPGSLAFTRNKSSYKIQHGGYDTQQTANIHWAHKPQGTRNISFQTEDIIYYDRPH